MLRTERRRTAGLRGVITGHKRHIAALRTDLRHCRIEFGRMAAEALRYQREAEQYAPGRVTNDERRRLDVHFKIDPTTLAYQEHTFRGVIDRALEDVRRQLYDAFRKR